MHEDNYQLKPHLLKKLWIMFKLTYLHLCYFLVGLDDDYYYIMKGDYLKEIHCLNGAIRSYQKALRDSKDARVHLSLASCLLHSRRFHEAVDHFQIAYNEFNDPNVALGLAIVEYEMGNLERCHQLVQQVEGKDLCLTNNEALKKLKEKIEQKEKTGITKRSTGST